MGHPRLAVEVRLVEESVLHQHAPQPRVHRFAVGCALHLAEGLAVQADASVGKERQVALIRGERRI